MRWLANKPKPQKNNSILQDILHVLRENNELLFQKGGIKEWDGLGWRVSLQPLKQCIWPKTMHRQHSGIRFILQQGQQILDYSYIHIEQPKMLLKKVQDLPVCNALTLLQDPVVLWDGVGEVCQQGDVHWTQATLLPWCVNPEQQTFWSNKESMDRGKISHVDLHLWHMMFLLTKLTK